MTGQRSLMLSARPFLMVTLLATGLSGLAQPAAAQLRPSDYYHPLSQHAPPGKAAAWLNQIRHYDPAWTQPIVVETPAGGTVSIYSGSSQPLVVDPAPAAAAVNVGHLYRLRVSGMTDFPGIDLYPTVELLDRLHPPAGREFEFPIPIIITPDDVRTAVAGQLITRVIYLEQPQIAQVADPLRRVVPQQLPPSENTLKEADRLGRPMAILRIGGRRPTSNTPPNFFGSGGSVVAAPGPAAVPQQAVAPVAWQPSGTARQQPIGR